MVSILQDQVLKGQPYYTIRISNIKIRIIHDNVCQINSLIKLNNNFQKKLLFDFHMFFHPFILQNYKKIFKSRSTVLRTQHCWTHNNPFTLNKILKPLIWISFASWPLSLCKIANKSLKCIQSYEDVPSSTQNVPCTPNSTFFQGIIDVIFICLFTPFKCKILKFF